MSDDLGARLQRSLGDAFTLERELGGGGMAQVFLATDRALERRVVVKVLDLEGAVDASAERFRREVKVIAQLQHPHIVPVLTAGGDGTLLWYVMPYVSGESLRARLVREGALPLADALRIARELLDALAFAHDHGIVHRDVKPENILLEGRHAVVADFGVAKALADAGVSGAGLTSIGLALGTPAYMAPEQALADATTNHRADLYASGAVLYEMLAGAPPFSGNAQSVIAAHLTAPVPRIEERRSDVPPMVAALIARLMAKNPAERPQSAHEVAVALESVATPGASGIAPASPADAGPRRAEGAATPVAARPEAGSAAAPSALARVAVHRRPVGALVAALVVVVAGIAWWRSSAGAAPVVKGAGVIAVMPLGSTGDTATARLGRDLVVTMSANLDGVGSLRAVDAMSVLQRAQALPQPVPLDEARRLGAELGARSVLHGSLVREGTQVRAELALYSVEGGEPLARFRALGDPDSLRGFTDTLSAELLRAIWRRGQAPSPLLSEVTTANGEALRAFLVGERAFGESDTDAALEAYERAVAADPLFAQAWLRIDYTRSLALMGPDSLVRRQLGALRHRLPARDRELLELRWSTTIPVWQRIDSGRVLAARYPDYHTAQYQVGDNIIHSGPQAGIPITEALPYLARLEALAPNHADNALHRMMVHGVLGDSVEIRRAVRDLVARAPAGGEVWGGTSLLRAMEAADAGRRIPADTIVADLRPFLSLIARNAGLAWFAPSMWHPSGNPAESEEVIAAVSRSSMSAGLQPLLALSSGSLDVLRGNATRGVERLAALETMRGEIPVTMRLTAVRAAAQSAWLGTLPVEEAEAVYRRTASRLTDLRGINARDLQWADGVIAIAAGDSMRLARALARLDDSTAANLKRGLRGLWRERRTGAVDSLIAAEDEAMANSLLFYPALPLNRAAIGRQLVRDGQAARAEHYLQWTDGLVTGPRAVSIVSTMGSYNSYERGLAREAAGDIPGARLHLQRFVTAMDQPPPAIRGQVEDAKARLKRLEARDR